MSTIKLVLNKPINVSLQAKSSTITDTTTNIDNGAWDIIYFSRMANGKQIGDVQRLGKCVGIKSPTIDNVDTASFAHHSVDYPSTTTGLPFGVDGTWILYNNIINPAGQEHEILPSGYLKFHNLGNPNDPTAPHENYLRMEVNLNKYSCQPLVLKYTITEVGLGDSIDKLQVYNGAQWVDVSKTVGYHELHFMYTPGSWGGGVFHMQMITQDAPTLDRYIVFSDMSLGLASGYTAGGDELLFDGDFSETTTADLASNSGWYDLDGVGSITDNQLTITGGIGNNFYNYQRIYQADVFSQFLNLGETRVIIKLEYEIVASTNMPEEILSGATDKLQIYNFPNYTTINHLVGKHTAYFSLKPSDGTSQDLGFYFNLSAGLTQSITIDNVSLKQVAPINQEQYVVEVEVDAKAQTPEPNDYIFFGKENKVNISGVRGYFAEVEMKNDSTDAAKLFSVGSEMTQSSK